MRITQVDREQVMCQLLVDDKLKGQEKLTDEWVQILNQRLPPKVRMSVNTFTHKVKHIAKKTGMTIEKKTVCSKRYYCFVKV